MTSYGPLSNCHLIHPDDAEWDPTKNGFVLACAGTEMYLIPQAWSMTHQDRIRMLEIINDAYRCGIRRGHYERRDMLRRALNLDERNQE